MSISASKTRRVALSVVALCAASCAKPTLKPAPAYQAARVMSVTDDHVTLRASAYLELYAKVGASDRDEIRALAPCEDDRCALAVAPKLGPLLPPFLAQEWTERSRIIWAGIDRAHEAWNERADTLILRVAKDLDATTAPVNLVTDVDTDEITPFLSTNSGCFRGEDVLADCVAVRAILGGDSPLHAILGERLWTATVVHVVAAVMTQLEPRHLSIDRRAVGILDPDGLSFVTQAWQGGRITPELAQRWRVRAYVPPDNASH